MCEVRSAVSRAFSILNDVLYSMLTEVINPCATFWTFLSFSVCYFYHIACVIDSCINFGTGVFLLEFYYFTPISFNKSIMHLVQNSSSQDLKDKNVLMLFLITVLFNCKTMQFLLISFHSVGKASKPNFFHFFFFLRDGAIFSGLAYKANTRFIPVFCFCCIIEPIG